jgi:hypothetical protein
MTTMEAIVAHRAKLLPISRILPRAVGACGMLLAGSSQAYAYLDPGTGSILLQVILGALAAGAAALVSCARAPAQS